MQDKIKVFLEDHFLTKFNEEVTAESNLFELGVIDSFGYIELITFLEKEFQITLTEEEIVSDALISLSSITQLVKQKHIKGNN